MKRLVDQALARESSERRRFLDESCAGDESLRAEVESLLRYEQDALLDSAAAVEDDLAGRKLAHYDILGELGRGGMGRVYRARDERLDGSVALKVLPPLFAADPDRLRRFEREARLIAALSHPHVATIHGLDHVEGIHFLVLELVPGQTLRERLGRGRLPLDEALRLARQIAEALEAAHDKGVVHRDLKPSNVKVTEEGAVKVLDFGLAKALRDRSLGGEAGAEPGQDLETKEGVVVGTPAYMSPEQVGGIPVDHRTDVLVLRRRALGDAHGRAAVRWGHDGRGPGGGAAGGSRVGAPAQGRSGFDSRASGAMPDAGPALSPAGHRRGADRDRAEPRRLEWVGNRDRPRLEPSGSKPAPSSMLPTLWRWWPVSTVLLALCAVSLVAAVVVLTRRSPAAKPPLRKWAFTPPQELTVTSFNADVKLSPDGRHVAYNGDRTLWVLDLDAERPRKIEGVGYAIDPFWSADSSFIGYFSGGNVMKVPVQGGSASVLCPIPEGEPWGASWSPDGEVVVISSGFPGNLYEVSAQGGDPKLILSASATATPGGRPLRSIYRPHFLPGEAGRRVILFAFGVRTAPNMMVWDLDTGERRILGAGALPMYSPSGHIVYQETGLVYRLWAVPFSTRTLDVTGRPFLVSSSGRDPVVSFDGTLAYVEAELARVQLTWFDRHGRKVDHVGEPERCLGDPALSPDGKRIAAVGGDDRNFRDAWVYDVERGARTRLTSAPENLQNVFGPVWSPSGDEVAFTVSNRYLDVRAADASGAARTVLETTSHHQVADWSSDGRRLVYEIRTPQTGTDIAFLEHDAAGEWRPRVFLATPFEEVSPEVSPDGRYIAYVSDQSGHPDVYVRPFPSGSGQWLVSKDGGSLPVWGREGRELFYLDRRQRLVSVEVSTQPGFSLGPTTPLFEYPEAHRDLFNFDASPDGSRFIIPATVGEQPRPVIHVVENWAAEFEGTR